MTEPSPSVPEPDELVRLSDVTLKDVGMFQRSLVEKDTPWSLGCAVVLVKLWQDRIAAIERITADARRIAELTADKNRLDWLDRDDIDLEFGCSDDGEPRVTIVLWRTGAQLARAEDLRNAIDIAMTARTSGSSGK